MANREIQYGRQHGRQILQVCFWSLNRLLVVLVYMQNVYFDWYVFITDNTIYLNTKKKDVRNIKDKIRKQMANFWSKNRALRRNRSSLKLLKRYYLLNFNLNNTPVIIANLNIMFLLKILNQYWTVSSLLLLPPPFDFKFSELMLLKLDKRQ